MEKPKPESRKPILNYLDMVKFIESKYNIKVRDYHETYNKENEDWLSYLDYWHWLVDSHFYEVHNPCDCYFHITEIIKDKSVPNWVKEITQLFHNEFKDDLDKDGGLEVHISW